MRAAPQPPVRLSKPAGAGGPPPAPATSTTDQARQLVLLEAAAAALREALEQLLVEHDCPEQGDCQPWCAPCRAVAAMSATDAGVKVLEQLDAYRLFAQRIRAWVGMHKRTGISGALAELDQVVGGPGG